MRIYFHKPYQEHGNFWQWLAVAYCTSGLGLLPRRIGHKLKGCGTIGSIVGLGLATGLELYNLTWLSLILVPIMIGLAWIAIPPAEIVLSKWWGAMRRHKGIHLATRDYNVVNIDEVIPGLIIVLAAHWLHPQFWKWLITATLMTALFRMFDSQKPWPINMVEKKLEPHYPWDVLTDDLVGVVITIAVFEAAYHFFFTLIPLC